VTTAKANNPLSSLTEQPKAAVTPNDLLDKMYSGLSGRHGSAFNFEIREKTRVTENGEKIKTQVWVPTEINERFFAALLTQEANQEDPAVFDQDENWWYRFQPRLGFYSAVKGEARQEKLSSMLFDIAKKCRELDAPVDVSPLEFKFRKTSVLAPVVTKAIGIAAVKGDYWERPMLMVPVRNGVDSIEDGVLHPHSADWHYRGVIGADYEPTANCPRWIEFVNGALDNVDDRELLQRIFGLLMVGVNFLQIMVLMYGEAQSGKGTIARVMASLVGKENTATLRTDKLSERFELGRLRHKLLLYGPDVSQDFLNVSGAYLLKCITGEDPISPEYKNSNAVPAAQAVHGLPVVTSNSRLRVRFEGDKTAWKRRLVALNFGKAVSDIDRINSLSEILMDSEASGILNYALDGVRLLAKDGCRLGLTDRQKQVRDSLLDESKSYVAFAREGVFEDEMGQLTADQAWRGYVNFFTARGWSPAIPQVFGTGFKQVVVDLFGITQSHDLEDAVRKTCRGWHGLKLSSRNRTRIYADRDFAC
jgi:P4 family phage/plasmid primase-like protien